MRTFNLADLSSFNILPLILVDRHQRPVVPLLGLAFRDGAFVDAHVHPDFQRPPDDETQAVTALIRLRWPHGWKCGRCGHGVHTRSTARPRQLRCASCGERRSVTAGTALDKKHDLPRWFAAAIALGAARQASARRFAIAWRCNYKTAWATMHLLRKESAALRDPRDLGGTWTACHDTHGCRPNKPLGTRVVRRRRGLRWRSPPPRFAGFVAVGPNAVYFAERRRWSQLNRAVPQLSMPTSNVPNDARVVSRHGRLVLSLVHRTVSMRWVQRYLDALAQRATWVRRGLCPSAMLLVAATAAGCCPWETVPPT
jgi:DNA-directed RNA polymerase subunit RPC12/RpoP